jgi:phosphatidylglycerophosphate synthase
MLDAIIRKQIDLPLAVIARHALKWRISATAATVAGFVLGLVATALVASQLYLAAGVVFVLSRVCDGLDGAMARQSRPTDLGAYLDVVLDITVYAAILFGFALADPAANALAASFVATSGLVAVAARLAYDVIGAHLGQAADTRGLSALSYLSGIADAAGTTFCVFAMCIFPNWFSVIAVVYSVLCWIGAGARIALAISVFGEAQQRTARGAAQ